MDTIYTPPSLYSGGFSKAFECIEMMALQAINNGFDTIGSQDYKYTNAVIDEETGEVLN